MTDARFNLFETKIALRMNGVNTKKRSTIIVRS